MKGLSIFAVALAVASFFALAQAGHGKMKCDGQEMKTVDHKAGFAAMKPCLDKYAPETKLADDASDDDKKKAWVTRWKSVQNNTCFHVCKYTAQKIFDSTGAFNQAGSDTKIDNLYPTAELGTQMKDGIKKCAEGQTFSMDNECASYKEFIGCMFKKHFEVCKIDAKSQTEEEV